MPDFSPVGSESPAYTFRTSQRPTLASIGRFIRLGRRRSWAHRAFETQTIRFGDPDEPHDLCLSGDWLKAKDSLQSSMGPRKAGHLARQLHDFYTLGSDCLWVTFVDGLLWWGFADPEVIDLRGSDDEMGIVARRIRGGWSYQSLLGKDLRIPGPGRDFRVRRYRSALCNLKELDAICRVIEESRGRAKR